MYKVNEKTKIGRAIKKIIENNNTYKDFFYKHNISFLTQPTEERSEMNIHIYPEDRLEHLKQNINGGLGRFTEHDIHIPGCITNFLLDNLADINYILDTHEIEIIVEFGRNAASSRRYREYTEYPVNSHIQKKEIELMLQPSHKSKEITLKHCFNPTKLDSKIIIIGTKYVEFVFDSVQISAQMAIDSAYFFNMKMPK